MTMLSALPGCGGDDDMGGAASCNGIAPTSVQNVGHTHAVCVPQSLLDAPQAATITLELSAGHTHTIDLTTQNVIDIRDNSATVMVTSTGPSHTHVVTFLMS